MRVAIISVHGCPFARLGEKDTGGMNVFVLETAKELGSRGVFVDVYTRCHDPRDPQIQPLGPRSRVVHLRAGPWDEGKLAVPRRLPEFTHNLLRYQQDNGLKYDLLHSHYWLSGSVALGLASMWRLPVVSSFHTLGKIKKLVRATETETRQRIRAEKLIVSEATVLTAGSPYEKELLSRLYGAPRDKVHIVPCGIDPELFRPLGKSAARTELGLDDSKVVLFVGRIEPIKGIDILLRALASLEDKERLKVLVIGGEPNGDPEAQKLRALASELGVAGKISFLGPLPQKKLPLYYSAADVCVMPSYYESFGLVAVEAMACGTPVVAARVGGLQSTVKDGLTGFLVSGHCPDPYSERLEVLLGNDALRRHMGEAARNSVQGLSWEKVVDRLLEVYNLALDQAPSAESSDKDTAPLDALLGETQGLV